jgi:hypothetical protein
LSPAPLTSPFSGQSAWSVVVGAVQIGDILGDHSSREFCRPLPMRSRIHRRLTVGRQVRRWHAGLWRADLLRKVWQ